MSDVSIAKLAGVLIIIALICVVIGVISIIAMWKIFKKADEEGWKAIIPIYNTYTLCKIVWGNGWMFLLMCVPFGNIVMVIATMFRLAKVFGKGTGFGFGLLFLGIIFYLILAFGSSEYEGSDEYRSNKGIIIAAIVVCIAGFVLIAAASILGVSKIGDADDIYTDIIEEDYDFDYEDDNDYEDENKDNYTDAVKIKDCLSSLDTKFKESKIFEDAGHTARDGFTYVEIKNSDLDLYVPAFEGYITL